MRKIVSLGLFALMLSMFSSQVFAGKIAVCEPKNVPAYKGLYGLCNAYYNADDEEAKAQILANFEKKAGTADGGPEMPTDAATCPCWDDQFLDDITGDLAGVFCRIDSVGDSSDFALYHGEGVSVNLSAGFLNNSPFEGTWCVVGAFGVGLGDDVDNPFVAQTFGDEDAACSQILKKAMIFSMIVDNILNPDSNF